VVDEAIQDTIAKLLRKAAGTTNEHEAAAQQPHDREQVT
jgi:hypothetical protein